MTLCYQVRIRQECKFKMLKVIKFILQDLDSRLSHMKLNSAKDLPFLQRTQIEAASLKAEPYFRSFSTAIAFPFPAIEKQWRVSYKQEMNTHGFPCSQPGAGVHINQTHYFPLDQSQR